MPYSVFYSLFCLFCLFCLIAAKELAVDLLGTVYTNVVIRAESANDLVLDRCLRLLKRYLPHRPPSGPVLQEIDRFSKACSATARFGQVSAHLRRFESSALPISALFLYWTRSPMSVSC